MTIGNRIRSRRIELGITQDELASKLGYRSKSSINKIELGVQDLPQKKIVDFAKALDTTPAYLMGWEQVDLEVMSDYIRKAANKAKYQLLDGELIDDSIGARVRRAYEDADPVTQKHVRLLLGINEEV